MRAVLEQTDGRGADLAVEVVGNGAALATAIASIRRGGRVGLIGNLAPEVPFPLQAVSPPSPFIRRDRMPRRAKTTSMPLRPIARPTTWFIGVKPNARTRSGRLITLNWICGQSGPTARQNALLNKIRGVKFRVADVRRWKTERSDDVVMANLFSELLIEILPELRAANWLILSGILRNQERDVRRALTRHKTEILDVCRRGKWVAILAGRK